MKEQVEQALDWQKRVTSNDDGGTEICQIYDRWASSYDAELRYSSGYLVPQLTIEVLTRLVAPSAKILDAGAGTGLVGEALYERGYCNVVGMDMSANMLKEAAAKGIYRSLQQGALGEPLDMPSNWFDAVVAVGVLGPTHAPTKSFEELVRVTRSCGHIVFSMRVEECVAGGEFCRALDDIMGWRRLTRSVPFRGFAARNVDLRFCIFSYQVD